MSSLEKPTAFSPSTILISAIYCLKTSAKIFPASSSRAELTSAPEDRERKRPKLVCNRKQLEPEWREKKYYQVVPLHEGVSLDRAEP